MTQPRITDVVFDFCGVLVDWQWGNALKQRAGEEFMAHLDDPDDPYGFFHYEDRMDGGELLADIMPDIIREQGEQTAQLFAWYIAHYDEALPRLIPGAEQLLRDLRNAGVHTWGLTNWSSETFHLAYEKYPVLNELLDDTLVSGIEHLHKPEMPIYREAERRFHLDPARTVFFDDTMRNVEGARACGWNAYQFIDTNQARHDLATLGISLPQQ